MKKVALLTVTVIVAVLVPLATADVPQMINYQGRLADSLGNPVSDGDYQITFSIWNWPSGGTLLWTSEAQTIPVVDGLFTYQLGSNVQLPHSLFIDSLRWLAIKVGDDEEITPRTQLTPAPYAYHALRADTAGFASSVDSQGVTNEMIMDTTIGFEKFAHNDGEPGDVITFLGDKRATIPWGRMSIDELVPPTGWRYLESIITLMDNNDRVGIGTAIPEARLHVYSNDPGIDPFHVSIKDPLDGFDTRLMMSFSGNVGVGTTDPGGHQLSVESSGDFTNSTVLIKNTHPTTGVAIQCENTSAQSTMIVKNLGTGDLIDCFAQDTSVQRVFRVKHDGEVECAVLHLTGGADIVEPFEMSHHRELPAGAVVVIDPENPGKLKQSTSPYDTRVAGIVSGAGGVNPGIRLSQDDTFATGQNVAIGGRVYCQVDATYGAIKPGDLLTTSPSPGHAMKATDRERSYGAVIGKAMTALDSGQGMVLVLVNLH